MREIEKDLGLELDIGKVKMKQNQELIFKVFGMSCRRPNSFLSRESPPCILRLLHCRKCSYDSLSRLSLRRSIVALHDLQHLSHLIRLGVAVNILNFYRGEVHEREYKYDDPGSSETNENHKPQVLLRLR